MATQTDGHVVGLLKWPKDPKRYGPMSVPVVSMERGGKSVRLVSRSLGEYVHRALVEEENAGEGTGERSQ